MDEIIFGIFLVIILSCCLAFLIYYGLSTDKARKEYLSTLNEHDLSVIQKYNNCSLFPFKKGVKK